MLTGTSILLTSDVPRNTSTLSVTTTELRNTSVTKVLQTSTTVSESPSIELPEASSTPTLSPDIPSLPTSNERNQGRPYDSSSARYRASSITSIQTDTDGFSDTTSAVYVATSSEASSDRTKNWSSLSALTDRTVGATATYKPSQTVVNSG